MHDLPFHDDSRGRVRKRGGIKEFTHRARFLCGQRIVDLNFLTFTRPMANPHSDFRPLRDLDHGIVGRQHPNERIWM
ncbi:hypothetical protein ACIBG0_04800 [Nocardia sp. NPDC050630]|uniref:hypothetical protein n=1 Tax=Nocardia sp. NPDC050630 TaxID=3364321 RepID=UPI00379F93F7